MSSTVETYYTLYTGYILLLRLFLYTANFLCTFCSRKQCGT